MIVFAAISASLRCHFAADTLSFSPPYYYADDAIIDDIYADISFSIRFHYFLHCFSPPR
jgi:hypothetical protein